MLGGDADGNLGDRAILQATCRQIQELAPEAAVAVVSGDGARASRDYGARAIAPGPRGFLSLCAAAARSDLVLIGGGGLFQDDDSLVKMPYWALRVALMRLFCRRVVGYALGVGPLRAGISRLAARLAFACMEQVTVRDPEALEVAQPLTGKRVGLVPDPALLLPPADPEAARDLLRRHGVPLDGRPLVGVALRRWFPAKPRIVPNKIAHRLPWRRERPPEPEAEALTAGLARALDALVREHGAFVLFLPTYTYAHEGDDRVCEAVAARMTAPAGARAMLRLDDAALYKAVAGELAVLLGGRMHPTILAAAMGTPVVGLAYNPKFMGFFELLGAADRVLDVGRFVREDRAEELSALLDGALRERSGPPRERIETLTAPIRSLNRALFGELAR
ncbi:polysaccharide pyruvyl transferase family protein [Benzoatithermus flavus]|uniref:Polysaccharide pyruvyl transferase family protein n=1 Tax=Benzoatithermus flavus TaxID=3108223 RepID=A0ABU8XS04_9PROT